MGGCLRCDTGRMRTPVHGGACRRSPASPDLHDLAVPAMVIGPGPGGVRHGCSSTGRAAAVHVHFGVAGGSVRPTPEQAAAARAPLQRRRLSRRQVAPPAAAPATEERAGSPRPARTSAPLPARTTDTAMSGDLPGWKQRLCGGLLRAVTSRWAFPGPLYGTGGVPDTKTGHRTRPDRATAESPATTRRKS